MKTTLELARTTKNGKPAIELIVRHAPQSLVGLLDQLGITPTVDMMGRRSVIVSSPAELDAVRDPLKPYFDAKGNFIGQLIRQ